MPDLVTPWHTCDGGGVRVLGAARAREADARTIAAGTPGIVLMDRASEAVARECVRAIEASPLRGERVVILCGTGNNGGLADSLGGPA